MQGQNVVFVSSANGQNDSVIPLFSQVPQTWEDDI